MEGQTNWKKWHQLTDALRISLNSTVPTGTIPICADIEVPENLDEEMIYRAKKVESKLSPAIAAQFGLKAAGGQETVDRHYHPRVGFEKGKVTFKVHIMKVNPEDKMPFKGITLWKRGVDRDVHAMLKCGRAGESRAFGFNAGNNNGKTNAYVTLAYPGLTGKFEPLFVKVSEITGRELDSFFLKITAEDGPDNTVVVEAKEVDSREVPVFLQKV